MKLRQVLGISFSILALAAFVACGGGSSSGTTDNGGADVIGDTTPEGDVPVTTDTPTTDPGTDVPGTDIPGNPDVPVDTPDVPVVPDVPCVPDCKGKVCGNFDGCGGSCGDCTAPQVCALAEGADQGTCVAACDMTKLTWGPVGVIDTASTPKDATLVATVCPDYSGDGKGDNGLKNLADTVNPEIQKAVAGGTFGIIMEFAGVTDFASTASFTLGGLFGEPKAEGSTEYLVDPASYDAATCKPLIAFDEASITGGALAAGPSQFILQLPIQDIPLTFTLLDAKVAATVTAGGADGVTATDGVLAGVLTKAKVDEALAFAADLCKQNPQSWCSYLDMAPAFLPLLFDLDLEPAGAPDGKKDAASICLQFTLKKGTVAGLKPAE